MRSHAVRMAAAGTVAAATLAPAAPASAIDIARWIVSQYQGPNNSGPMTPLSPSASATNVSVTAISAGPGLVSLGACGGGLSLIHCAGAGEMLAVFYSSAFNPDDYFEFTIDPDPGYSITYQSVRMPMGQQYTIAPVGQRSSGPKTWQLRYSLDGFATPGTILQTLNPFAMSFTTPVGAAASEEAWPVFNLAALGTRSAPVTFRLYGYNIETNHPSYPVGFAGGPMNRTVFMPQVDALLSGTVQSAVCYADCNASGTLTIADFGCFQGKYVLGDLYADCTADGQLTVADFGCYQGKYVLGCP
ncbi:MAG: hypothetical protein ACKVU4_05520 [Phycisphaerales bacterium]